MTGLAAGGALVAVLLGLLFLRIPIAVAMIAVGLGGSVMMRGWAPLLSFLKTEPYYSFSTYSLSVIPLFLLMGHFAAKAGLSQALFDCANRFLGHLRGGLAMAAIGGCAGFGAICGSSLATAATMGQVALPEMRRHGYAGSLATGTLAAGGTLGILIPPSVVLVVYAILAEQNIAKLFMAAFVPGILAAIGYALAIAVHVRFHPADGPAGPRHGWASRLQGLAAVWPVLLIFVVVVGGINAGLFTPTEGAAVGAFGTGAAAVIKGGLGWRGLVECLLDTATSTAMIFLILLGAGLFNNALALTQSPDLLAAAIKGAAADPYLVLIAMLLVYLLLGCLMDSLSMILLTIPIFFPIVMGLDFGLPPDHVAIWFGILALIVVEVGLITPPVGMNVFIINGLARDVPMADSFRGVLPFLISDFLRVALLVAFPGITLFALRWVG